MFGTERYGWGARRGIMRTVSPMPGFPAPQRNSRCRPSPFDRCCGSSAGRGSGSSRSTSKATKRPYWPAHPNGSSRWTRCASNTTNTAPRSTSRALPGNSGLPHRGGCPRGSGFSPADRRRREAEPIRAHHDGYGMVIRLLAAGGLGNQLFQYAAVGAQAKRLGVEMEIDLPFYDPATPRPYSFWLAHLPIRARLVHYPQSGPLAAHGLARRAWRKLATPIFWRRYRQPAWTEDHRFFQIADRTIVSGYFQSLFYLRPRDEEVLA